MIATLTNLLLEACYLYFTHLIFITQKLVCIVGTYQLNVVIQINVKLQSIFRLECHFLQKKWFAIF